MKILNFLFLLIFSLILITSCQKELNFDDTSGASSGSLKKDTSDCLPSTVHGEYITGSLLTADNYIEVQVNVNVTGTYTIQSDTVNGYTFRDSGRFGNPGLNTVRLYGTGKPILPGLHSFIIRYDTSICIIDVNAVAAGADAEYTFAGAGATCTGTVLGGTYMQDVALSAANTATVSLQITMPGNYFITTTSVNGVIFSASGTFTDISQTTVVLTAQGTPAASGTFNYALLGNGTGCAFSVTFDPPVGPAVFTVDGAPGNCSLAQYTGIYQIGTPSTGNTAMINVTVITPGSYFISTPVVNGVSFSGSGVFTSTGTGIPVTLAATGTPTGVPGPVSFPFTGGGTSCSFTIPFN